MSTKNIDEIDEETEITEKNIDQIMNKENEEDFLTLGNLLLEKSLKTEIQKKEKEDIISDKDLGEKVNIRYQEAINSDTPSEFIIPYEGIYKNFSV